MTATVLSECVRMGADGSGFVGSDVYDAEFDDFGSAWETDDSPGEETAVYHHIMAETEAVRIVPEEYGHHIVADIAGFVRRNAESLKAFSEEYNRPECHIDNSEEGVWNGICTIHGLMCGYYPEDAYAWLAREWGCRAWPPYPASRTRPPGLTWIKSGRKSPDPAETGPIEQPIYQYI